MTEHDALQRTLRTFYAQWSVAWAKTHSNPTALSRAASADTERFVTESIAEIAHVLALTAKPEAQQRGLTTRLKNLHQRVPITNVSAGGLSPQECTAFQKDVVDALVLMLRARVSTTAEQPARMQNRGGTTRGAQTPPGTTGTGSGGSRGQRAKPPASAPPAAPSKSGGVIGGILGGLAKGVKATGALDGILGGLKSVIAGGAAGSLNDLLGGFRGGGGRTRGAPPAAPTPAGSPAAPSSTVVPPKVESQVAKPPKRDRSPTKDAAPPGATSAGAEPPEEVPERVKAILSADAPKNVIVGTDAGVDVRIELDASTAAPLPTSTSATISRVEKIAVIVTVFGDAIALVDPFLKLLDAPTAETPTTAQFAIRGVKAGTADITVQFMQGSAPLGLLRLSLAVKKTAADPDARATATADGVEPAPDARDVLSLFIEEQKSGDQLTYRYLLTWDAKDLRYADYSSAPFLDRGSGVGATPLAYIQSIYQRIVDRALVNYNDLAVFKSEVEGIGLEMCTQLFDNELARLLWQYRDDLQQVCITSKEAYVPWELLVLRNPDGRGPKSVDDRHLAERKLLRALRGKQAPSTLALNDWRYVISDFPEGSFAATQSELPLFTNTLPARGVQVSAIAPTTADVLQAMTDANFDVLHFSGHGLASPDKIDEATLILGDRKKPNGEIEAVGLQPDTLSQRYELSERHPLVFLNACETGRQAPSLTNMGGWPKKFLDLGASVFVGTSWSVREKPAAAFSRTFYESLLDHHTLADAADQARDAAKKLGDASWLAYTVYGQPSARRA